MHSKPVVNSLEELIEQLRDLFDSDQVDIDAVKQLLKSYQSNPLDWSKYTLHDPKRYTRNLVDCGNGKYNLMLLCWPKNTGSSIHDHSDAHCVMKILSGALYEVGYSWPKSSQKMVKTKETRLDRENSVAYINDSIGLHRVENRDLNYPSVSLHLYCPPFNQCHVFDEQTGQYHSADVDFDSSHDGKLVNYKVSRKRIPSSITTDIKEVLMFESFSKSRK